MKLDHRVNRPLPFVFDCLFNMQKFVEVHPVIYKIKNIGGNSYRISEKLKLGFVPFAFNYTASVEGNSQNGTVVMKALVMKVVKINIVFSLQAEGENTLVNETVTFSSILPVKPILETIFRKQHTRLFENINQLA